MGLTTTKAPFIEKARANGELFIRQPYELYSEENQRAWQKLYAQMEPKWQRFAHTKFLEGIRSLLLNRDRIPKLEEINAFLAPLTGFKAKAVSGYVSPFDFFDCLAKREFPTTITIRDSEKLDYLPEPDIFHDIGGHVPMHTDPTFAQVLVKFGSLARSAKESALEALSRFFWFTIEFGLIVEKGHLRAYGSGLLSSAGEIVHAIESQDVERHPFDLEKVISQPFEIDRYQPILFIIDSFDRLYEEVEKLESWLLEGRLDRA